MRLLIILATLVALAANAAELMPQAPSVAAKSWVLYDFGSRQILAGSNADQRIEPASLTKMMTSYVVLAALKQGSIKADQLVPISEKAWKTGGSRMFVEPNRPVSVDELLSGLVIQSGNDACVALAEAVAGSEEAFAQLMNREAQRLGLKNTHFTNATGLNEPHHYSTAHDLALVSAALIRDFPEHYALHSRKDYTYNRIKQLNRNRLLWLDPTVDGIKTGHTETAGYCLAASAQRGPRRLISVVTGTASDDVRTQESLKVLNFGFQFYDTVTLYKNDQVVREFPVWKGTQATVRAGFPDGLTLSLPKGAADKLKASVASRQPLLAPIAKGQVIGTLKLEAEGRSLGEYAISALAEVPVAGFFGRMWDTVRLWFE